MSNLAEISADKRQPAAVSGASYGQILKSSSIIGGAQGINYLIGMIRTKLVAVLLGPSGVGLVGLYVSATSLVSTLAGLGIGTSGIREVAEAHGSGDSERLARAVKTLRRACWATGFLGWIITVALAYPLSLWTFGSGQRTAAVALLGVTILFGLVSGGQIALIQGTRRIGDLARLNVIGVIVGTIVAVGLYGWLGERGIVPVLIVTAALSLLTSWWFARRVPVPAVRMNWSETWEHCRGLVGLGLAFMWSGLLMAAVALATRSIIVRQLGLDANGIYQAAWGISGVFAGFVLSAMGADFFPRLTAVASDNDKVNRLVNEQTEIGILLALPGMLGTLTFAPWVMRVFYSAQFLPGAQLLPWFVLGVFGQVVSWPIGFILVAKGAGGWFMVTETVGNVLRLTLTIILLNCVGLWGTALAMPLMYAFYGLGLLVVCRRLTGFRWSGEASRLTLISGVLVAAGFAVHKWAPGHVALILGMALTAASGVFCVRGIAFRLGKQHRVSRMLAGLPLLGRYLAG